MLSQLVSINPMTRPNEPSQPRISVLIKALNEEEKIERCLLSALSEARNLGGEVILVDSLSDDRTLEIANKFPDVRIVQFLSASDRGCGAATQLGFQFAKGEFVYVLDGDMVLESGFLTKALSFLEHNPDLAGVGGKVVDTHVRTASDARRVAASQTISSDQFVAELGGGGLYRRSAIETVKYLAHRWLPACEEAELGARLHANGWKLMRLSVIAVRHTGHEESDTGSLARLWKNKRAQAPGMLIRASLCTPWGGTIRKKFWYLLVAPLVHALAVALYFFTWIFGFVVILPGVIYFDLGLLTALWGVLAVKKRSAKKAFLSLITWHSYSVAGLLGFMRGLADPMRPIAARELISPSVDAA